MTEHNISHSEAFRRGPALHIRHFPRRSTIRWTPARFIGASCALGAVISLIDAWIGAPICLPIVLVAYVVAWIAPGRPG